MPRMILQALFWTFSSESFCVAVSEEDQAGEAYVNLGRMKTV